MDDPVESLAELEENLRDIERTNRWLGGLAPVKAAIFALQPRSVLDIGSGSADIPLALVRAAQARKLDLHITCLDNNAQMLQIARRRCAGHPQLEFTLGDGNALPYDDASFDVVTCNLALHHFPPECAAGLLREMRRVSRLTPLVCDLRRSRLGYAGAWLFSRLTTRNRLTRHDAPLSVARAYTPSEARSFAISAGWRNPVVHTAPFFRMVLLDA